MDIFCDGMLTERRLEQRPPVRYKEPQPNPPLRAALARQILSTIVFDATPSFGWGFAKGRFASRLFLSQNPVDRP